MLEICDLLLFYVEPFEREDGAGIGAVPPERSRVGIPHREYPLAVRPEEEVRGRLFWIDSSGHPVRGSEDTVPDHALLPACSARDRRGLPMPSSD